MLLLAENAVKNSNSVHCVDVGFHVLSTSTVQFNKNKLPPFGLKAVDVLSMDLNISVNEDRLSIVGQGLTAIPSDLGTKYGHLIKHLDLSDNNLTYAISTNKRQPFFWFPVKYF
jgi:hypothetical protein